MATLPLPTLQELQDSFTEEITEIATEALGDLGDKGVSETLQARIQDQVREGVQKEAAALSEAIYPFLERFSEARLSALSQSILQTTIQAIVVPEAPPAPPPVVVETVETVTNTTSSVSSSLEETFQQGATTSGGAVLWKWNRTDLSQFDTADIIKTSGVHFTMSYRPENNWDFDPGILVSVTYSHPGGGVAVRVSPSESLVLPKRFLVKVRYGRGPTFQSCTGPWFHNNAWTGDALFGTGVCHGGDHRAFALRAEGSASAGPPYPFPWTPPFVLPNVDNVRCPAIDVAGAAYPTSGLFVQYEVFLKSNPFPDPPVAAVSWLVQGTKRTGDLSAQGIRPDRGGLYAGFTSSLHQTQPVSGWNGITLDSFGLCFRHPLFPAVPSLNYGDGEIMINDIVIMTHWMDW